MDRNTIIGFVLILAIIGGMMYINTPSEEQRARNKFILDSTATAQSMLTQKDSTERAKSLAEVQSLTLSDSTASDSVALAQRTSTYGPFVQASSGSNELISIENEVMVL